MRRVVTAIDDVHVGGSTVLAVDEDAVTRHGDVLCAGHEVLTADMDTRSRREGHGSIPASTQASTWSITL
jgi:hypothetical protein